MECPICLAAKRVTPGKLRVLRTRDKGSHVERDRGCPVCDASFITAERDLGFFGRQDAELTRLRVELEDALQRLEHYNSAEYLQGHTSEGFRRCGY